LGLGAAWAFVAFIPAFFHHEKGDPLGYFREMPAWAVLLLALFLYLFLNFGFALRPGERTPDMRNGQCVLPAGACPARNLLPVPRWPGSRSTTFFGTLAAFLRSLSGSIPGSQQAR
jgi:hypothetical protein